MGWEDWDRLVPRNLGLVFMLQKWMYHATFHFTWATWAMSAVILTFRIWQFVVIVFLVWFIHNYFVLIFSTVFVGKFVNFSLNMVKNRRGIRSIDRTCSNPDCGETFDTKLGLMLHQKKSKNVSIKSWNLCVTYD